MDHINSVVCICETYEEAQRAMYNLEAAHIDMGTLSIATKDISSKLHQVDFYNFGDETFSIPDIGALLVSGRLSTWIAGAFHNSAKRGGLTIVGSALATIGIARDNILQYEAALRTGKYILVVHGSPDAVASALAAIGGTVSCFHTVHGKTMLNTVHRSLPDAKTSNTYQA
jgi:hypothetical protein